MSNFGDKLYVREISNTLKTPGKYHVINYIPSNYFISEFLGTFWCGFIGSLIYNNGFFQRKLSLHLRIQLVTLLTVAAVVSAFYYSGGFFQPLLAFIRTFGCVGYYRPEISTSDHVLVYWLGPTLAAVLLTAVKSYEILY